jgi:hypothetical protein
MLLWLLARRPTKVVGPLSNQLSTKTHYTVTWQPLNPMGQHSVVTLLAHTSP